MINLQTTPGFSESLVRIPMMRTTISTALCPPSVSKAPVIHVLSALIHLRMTTMFAD
jgi:hypothetical protein